MKEYHNLSIEETYQKLNSSEKGLSQEEAEARLSRYGKNALEEGKSKSWLQRFFAQMKDLMIIVLLFAAVLCHNTPNTFLFSAPLYHVDCLM